MLSQTTVPAAPPAPRAIRPGTWTAIGVAIVGALIVAFAVLTFGSGAEPAPATDEVGVPLTEEEHTRRLVNEGYLPAEVLEPAG